MDLPFAWIGWPVKSSLWKSFTIGQKCLARLIYPNLYAGIKNVFSKNSLQRETQYSVTALWPNEQICPGLQVNVSDSRSLS